MDHPNNLTLNQKKKIAVPFLNRFICLLNSRTKFNTMWRLLLEDYDYLSSPFNKYIKLSSRKEKLLQELAQLDLQLAPLKKTSAAKEKGPGTSNPKTPAIPNTINKRSEEDKPKLIPEIGADPVLQPGKSATPPSSGISPAKKSVDAKTPREAIGIGLSETVAVIPSTPPGKGARTWSEMAQDAIKQVPTPGSLAPPRKKGKEETITLPQQVKPPRANPFQHPVTQIGKAPASVSLKIQAGSRDRDSLGLREKGATSMLASTTTSEVQEILAEDAKERRQRKKMDALTKKSFHNTGKDYIVKQLRYNG